jgi:Fic family protein
MIELISEISERAGVVKAIERQAAPETKERRDSLIQAVHSSVAIEGNNLSLQEVCDVADGKMVAGSKDKIIEVKNALRAYEISGALDPCGLEDFLKAHKTMMSGLIDDAGRFRTGQVAVFAGERVAHVAPPARLVSKHMGDLFDWARGSKAHPLITSCALHYEIEFIHPFSDGNGRMGRLWQTLALSRWRQFFAWTPVETLIRHRQREYYEVLSRCGKTGDSSDFIEFMLRAVNDALAAAERVAQARLGMTAKIAKLLRTLGPEELSARELAGRMGLSHRQSFSRLYLKPALERGLIEMTLPAKPNSRAQKYRRVDQLRW